MSEKIEFSNIHGSIITVKSKLDNVQLSIGAMTNLDQQAKEELQQLVRQLSELLLQVPPNKAEDAEIASKRVETMVEEASKPKPDKELVKFSAESLKQAAANIGAVLPAVLAIADQIVDHVMKFIH